MSDAVGRHASALVLIAALAAVPTGCGDDCLDDGIGQRSPQSCPAIGEGGTSTSRGDNSTSFAETTDPTAGATTGSTDTTGGTETTGRTDTTSAAETTGRDTETTGNAETTGVETTQGGAETTSDSETETGADNDCGDGVIQGREVCDGLALGGQDCVSQGFDGGALGCTPTCDALDSSACSTCGNEILEGTEVCDGDDFGIAACTSEGFDGGQLGCSSDCAALDTSSCCDNQPPVVEFVSTGNFAAQGDGWQSFTSTRTGAITRADFFWNFQAVVEGEPFTLRIYEGVGTGGVLLHTQEFPPLGIGTFVGFEPNVLVVPVPVVAGSAYTIEGVDTFGWQTANGAIAGATSSLGPSQHKNIQVFVTPCE